MDAPRRKPVLTERILQEALPELLAVADGEIEYIQSRLSDTGAGALAAALKPDLETRLERLNRARDWLAGMVTSVTEKRAKAV